jgi:hypothetical protein
MHVVVLLTLAYYLSNSDAFGKRENYVRELADMRKKINPLTQSMAEKHHVHDAQDRHKKLLKHIYKTDGDKAAHNSRYKIWSQNTKERQVTGIRRKVTMQAGCQFHNTGERHESEKNAKQERSWIQAT